MSSNPFPAHYPGRCAEECHVPIRAGDLICMTDDGPVHAQCADTTPDRPEPEPCPACWLTHPEGACDR